MSLGYAASYAVGTPITPYRWIWANAAARTAQVVLAAEVGFIGYQTDIALEFELLDNSPLTWGLVPPTDVENWRIQISNFNNATLATMGFQCPVNTGTAVAVLPVSGTEATEINRIASTTAAAIGSVSQMRQSGGGTSTSSKRF